MLAARDRFERLSRLDRKFDRDGDGAETAAPSTAELAEHDVERYVQKIHRMYEKRESQLNHDTGPRLSFTQSIGYCPGGQQIPAWKAVFFNPRTNLQTIDAVIDSIQSLV